jgi:hypothetical protein
MLAELKLHDRLAAPEPATLVGVTAHEVLFVPKLTTPANPFRAATVIAEVPGEPTLTVMLVGLAAMAKSWTV